MNQIIFTEDLNQFKKLKGSRKVNNTSLRRLTTSISQNGFLDNPIIVNEKMEVIDGNQRLEAAKRLMSKVCYQVKKGFTVDEHMEMNAKALNWKLSDFSDSYAKRGYESYLTLKEFRKENSEFSLTNSLSLLSNSVGFNQGDSFRAGTWEVIDLDTASYNAGFLRSLKDSIGKIYYRERFVTGFISCTKNPDFKYSEFRDNLNNKKIKGLFNEDANLTSGQYIGLIQETINVSRSRAEKISFKKK